MIPQLSKQVLVARSPIPLILFHYVRNYAEATRLTRSDLAHCCKFLQNTLVAYWPALDRGLAINAVVWHMHGNFELLSYYPGIGGTEEGRCRILLFFFLLRSFLTSAVTVICSSQNHSGGSSDMGNAVSCCNPSNLGWAIVHLSHPYPSARLLAKDTNSGRTKIMLWRHVWECLQMCNRPSFSRTKCHGLFNSHHMVEKSLV